MPDVSTSSVVPADAETVWRVVRDFDGLPTWHPAISASELEDGARTDQVGAVRHLTLGDGGAVRERLVALDTANGGSRTPSSNRRSRCGTTDRRSGSCR